VSHHPNAVYFRGSSDEFYLLALHGSTRKGIEHLAFGLPNEASVDEAMKQIEQAGAPIVHSPLALDEPGGGYGFRFLDPDGRCIELSSGVAAPRTQWRHTGVEPSSICHVVLNTSDIDRAASFYTDVLGFRISDWSEHQMVFLRCSSKHHAISFNQAPHASLNHVAYLVSGVDEVMRGLANLRKHGIEPAWGPGRHGPGNNIFCYFKDSAGYVTEYTSDIDYITNDATHQPKVWSRSPDAIDRWGLAGPPSPAVREAMTGEPDPEWAKGY
jgi:catechol 2,3-dioxygenase-like lactoylglutathione lyase family enzyme